MSEPVQDRELRPELEVDGPAQQDRLTVALRALLLIPQALWGLVLQIAASAVAFVGWFAALLLGRLPDGIARFLTGYARWAARYYGSYTLLVDRYPPFALKPADYPIRIEITPTRLNRLAVFFRWLLVIPASLLSAAVSLGWGICSFVIWLIVLIEGRMPAAVFEASAALLRYRLRVLAYTLLLTPAYPKGLFGDGRLPPDIPDPPPAAAPATTRTRPLLLSSGGRGLLTLFLVLGIVYFVVIVGVGAGLGVTAGLRSYSSTGAYNAVTTSFQDTVDRVTPANRRLQTCGSSLRPATCFHESFRRLATGFGGFSADVAGIDFPGYARDEVGALQRALSRLISTQRRLSVAPTAQQFQQILLRDNYPGRVDDARAAYNQLVSALREHI